MKEIKNKINIKYQGFDYYVEDIGPLNNLASISIGLKRLDNGAERTVTLADLLKNADILYFPEDSQDETEQTELSENPASFSLRTFYKRAEIPLERVEINIRQLDVFIISKMTGAVLGRPRLFIALDSYSHCIFGMHLSFDPPSVDGAIKTLLNGVFEKHAKEKYGTINDWDIYGLPKEIVFDTGKEFKSEEVIHIVTEVIGAEVLYRPIRMPQSASPTEQFFMELHSELISRLPGAENNYFSDEDVNPVQSPHCTLDELEKLIVKYIVDKYHFSAQRGLPSECNVPIVRYKEGIEMFGVPRIVQPEDEQRFRIKMMRQCKRKYTSDGVAFRGIRYNNAEFRGLIKSNVEYSIKYDNDDVSYIYLLDPSINEYVYMPAVHPQAEMIAGWSRSYYEFVKDRNKKLLCGINEEKNNQNEDD